VAVVSKKKPKVEAGNRRGKKAEEPVAADKVGKQAKAVKSANKKAANKTAASRKTAKKKTAGKKTAASKPGASTRAKTGKRTKKVPDAGALGDRNAGFTAGYAATDAAPAAGAWDPFEVAKQTMKGSVPAIVEAMVAKAKQGSCTHAKTLLEMTGARHMFGDEMEIADSGEPWAKLVLERMDEAEQESLQKKDLPAVAAEP
jgi:hypothetical protein